MAFRLSPCETVFLLAFSNRSTGRKRAMLPSEALISIKRERTFDVRYFLYVGLNSLYLVAGILVHYNLIESVLSS